MSYQFGHVDRDERIDYVEEPPPDDEYPPRRPIGGLLLAAGVMVVFAGGLWFAYHEGAKHAGNLAPSPDNVPLIRADTDPVKVKPDHAGGMELPDKDNPIYAPRSGSNPSEHILPPPEAPAPRPTAPPIQALVLPPATAPVTATQPAPAQAPRQIAALPQPAAAPTARSVPAAALRIQLASMRTPEAARDEWARLKRANGDLLGKLTGVAVRADLGERGIYYRVEAGPVADRAAAARLCNALKERGLGCSLVQ